MFGGPGKKKKECIYRKCTQQESDMTRYTYIMSLYTWFAYYTDTQNLDSKQLGKTCSGQRDRGKCITCTSPTKEKVLLSALTTS